MKIQHIQKYVESRGVKKDAVISTVTELFRNNIKPTILIIDNYLKNKFNMPLSLYTIAEEKD